ncbi:phosphoglycerate mutase (2,3-diphosphoglycerate-independent), partial [Staphylococcus cohnii]
PTTQIEASGLDVGLPEGQMGNSEVGHMNIGAGRVVYQSLTRINKSIEDGDFFENDVLNNAINHVKKNDSVLHVFGLLSDGGVHSHYKHLFALLDLAKKQGLEKVYVHAFLDGRDVDQKSALKYIEETEAKFKELGIGQFASVSGRYYAMDRDKRWDREEKAYNAIRNFGGTTFESAKAGVEANYDKDLTDEFVEPFIVQDQNEGVNDGDAVIFYNFRPDRAGQLSEIFTDKAFEGFKVEQINDLFYATFTKYNDNVNAEIVFEKVDLTNTIGEVAQDNGLKQL